MYHWWTYRLTLSVPARKISKDHYFGSLAYLSNKTYGSLIIYKKLQSILPGVSIHFDAQKPRRLTGVAKSPEHRSPPSKDQPWGIEANLGGWATRKDQEHPTENVVCFFSTAEANQKITFRSVHEDQPPTHYPQTPPAVTAAAAGTNSTG